MKKKIVYIVIGFILILAVTVGIIGRNRTRLKKVDVYKVEAQDFTQEVSANGEIHSRESDVMTSTVSGKVAKVYHEAGDHVVKGDLIVALDTDDMERQKEKLIATLESTRTAVRKELISLRSAYTQASTAYDQAERDYLRSQDLHDKKFNSEMELQAKQDAYHIANDKLVSAMQQLRFREGRDPDETGPDPRTDDQIVESSPEVKQALLNLKSQEAALENYRFRATIDGTVTDVNVEEGSVVSPGTPIASVHDADSLEVVANIDEVDLSHLSVGQAVRIESDSFIGTTLKGKVSSIAPIIRKVGDSRVCEIKVQILANPGNVARIGASCSVFITVENKKKRPAIPVEAYFVENEKKYVFLLVPDKYDDRRFTVKKQEVVTGILGIETVEAVSGVSVGDYILNSDRTGIADGDEVEKRKPDDKS